MGSHLRQKCVSTFICAFPTIDEGWATQLNTTSTQGIMGQEQKVFSASVVTAFVQRRKRTTLALIMPERTPQ